MLKATFTILECLMSSRSDSSPLTALESAFVHHSLDQRHSMFPALCSFLYPQGDPSLRTSAIRLMTALCKVSSDLLNGPLLIQVLGLTASCFLLCREYQCQCMLASERKPLPLETLWCPASQHCHLLDN